MRPACVTLPQSPQPTPPPSLPVSKRKKKETRARKTKTISAGLEDFIDWVGVVTSEPAKEEKMSSLVAEFSSWMRKRATVLEGKATSSFGGKRPRRSSPDKEAHKD